MNKITTENAFEAYIEKQLVALHGYRQRKNSEYDRAKCVDTDLLMEFVTISQPKAWEKMQTQYGDDARAKLIARVDEEIKERGTLDVLRKGIKDRGATFSLAYFRPNTTLNPETETLYQQNILSVTRQVHYSQKNENSIDMVLFVNGLPVFTMELKNQLTGQSVRNGLKQYQNDRDPRERLLQFKRCLAHFAVDTLEVFYTTKLDGKRTFFLPFNKGYQMGAGNPPAKDKYKTEYLWEDIWSKDMVFEILQRFMCLQTEKKVNAKGKKITKETLIFPRYHQLNAVRTLVRHAKENGSGKNYLIQHSAGSGKSNSIGWLAHRLAELHNEQNEKVFHSVIIITDRRVLDKQLQNTVAQFEQVRGVVKKIDQHSSQLREALEKGEKIIITTLQKFPVIVADTAVLKGKRFAVIVDEAHSSQTGESAKSLKSVLGESNEHDPSPETLEDMILKEMKARGQQPNVSFFAFTATPKQKTLEMFGEKQFDGTFRPFSVYSMKQAIEEGFILDVLKNYTTYKMYFSLMKDVEDDPEYQKGKAQRLLMKFVGTHEITIGKKVEIMVDHFWKNMAKLIDGKAKAMVVTRSRLHAAKYKRAIDAYLKEKKLPMKALVAFSGSIKDGGIEHTEASMNGVPENQTAEEFKKDPYKFLIVAEKFQTGFDEPLLSAMYVDKKLSGVSCVQTLSRLNRMRPRKESAFVLDFVNEAEDIQKAFQPYYTTSVLSEETDPNILHNLQRDLLNHGLFSESEITGFCGKYFAADDPASLNAEIDNVIERFDELDDEEKEKAREQIDTYLNKYKFLSQIVDYGSDTSLEKLYVYLRFYKKKLPVTKSTLPYEILDAINMESIKIPKVAQMSIALETEDGQLSPMEGDGRKKADEPTERLSQILKEVNDRFGTEFTDEDRIILNTLTEKLMQTPGLVGALESKNAPEAIKVKFNNHFNQGLLELFENHFNLYQKLDSNTELKDYVNEKIFDSLHQYLQRKNER